MITSRPLHAPGEARRSEGRRGYSLAFGQKHDEAKETGRLWAAYSVRMVLITLQAFGSVAVRMLSARFLQQLHRK